MIIVAGTIPINLEKRDLAIKAAATMVAATEQEEGCVTYRFYEDISKPGQFHVFEIWETAAHLAAHGKSAHMADFRKVMPEVLAGAPDIKRYDDVVASDL